MSTALGYALGMATMNKRGNSWSVVWRESGKQHRKTFKNRQEALTFKADTESAVYRGRRVAADGKTTFGTFWQTHQDQRLNVRESTLIRADEVARAHLLPRWADVRLVDVTHGDAQSWAAEMTVAPATVKKIVTEFRLCLGTAVKQGLIHANPATGLVLPKAVKADMTIVDSQTLQALADAVPERYRALVLMLGYCGLRIGEAVALTPADVAGGYITVNKTMTKTAQGMTTGLPKSAAGTRSVPMPLHIVETLTDHMERFPGRHVFTGTHGAAVQPHNFSQRTFKTAAKKVGVPSMRVHDLRHTAITYWVQAGIPLPQVVKWAGHSDASFTLNRYAHHFPKDDSKYMDLLTTYTGN